MAWVAVATAAVFVGCGGDPTSMTVKLEEVNDSGISGEVRLEEAEDRLTRMSVTEVRGGRITAAWVATGTCKEHGDEIITIHPPDGMGQRPFAQLAEQCDPCVALFLRRGRFVACGDL